MSKQNKLTSLQAVGIVITLPICLVLCLLYGDGFIATITERPGLNGYWYKYCNLTQVQFEVYEGCVAFFALALGFMIFFTAAHENRKKLNWSFISLLIFFLLLFLCEVYLATRFHGKG